MFLCNIALYSIGPCFYHKSHPQLGVVFALAPSLHSFWIYFTDLQYHIGHLPTWGFHLSVSYLFAFSYCSWGSLGKNTEVVCHFLLQWTTFYQTSPPWPDHLGWPYTPWLNFTELDKSVVRVISSLFFLLNVCWTHIYYYRSLIELIMSLILLYYINVFFPQMYVLGDIWHLSTLSSSVEQVRI